MRLFIDFAFQSFEVIRGAVAQGCNCKYYRLWARLLLRRRRNEIFSIFNLKITQGKTRIDASLGQMPHFLKILFTLTLLYILICLQGEWFLFLYCTILFLSYRQIGALKTHIGDNNRFLYLFFLIFIRATTQS